MPLILTNRSNGNGKLDLLQRGNGLGGIRMFTVSIGGGGGLDVDATAFIEAAGITDETQKSAINTLVTDLKNYGIWTKMKAIYPFVGGTATTHKWNLKDPRDVDAAFRLLFTGGLTHSSTGVDPNGTTGWANTFFVPKTHAAIGSVSYGCYIREDGDYGSGGGLNDMACGLAAFPGRHMALIARLYNSYYGDCWSNNNGRVTVANTDRRGFYIQSRTSTTDFRGYRNGVQIGTTNTNVQTSADYDGMTMSMALFCFHQGNNSITNLSKEQQAFAFIGDGLTDSDAANLYTAVQAYQTTLGRQV